MSTVHAYFAKDKTDQTEVLSAMVGASDYWKPDATAMAFSPSRQCGLGKALLENTVQSKNDLVFENAETSNSITANARIDNRSELAVQLGIGPDALCGMTDSQLILCCYEMWGQDCPKYLLGDFVFVIWDDAHQRIFAARDHFGVKSLFYSHDARGLMISGEHDAFFASKWLEVQIKEAWVAGHLWAQGNQGSESPCEGVLCLPAAHSMTFDQSGLQVQRYWSLKVHDTWGVVAWTRSPLIWAAVCLLEDAVNAA